MVTYFKNYLLVIARVLVLIVSFSVSTLGQKYILLDRSWNAPALETDTVTRQNLTSGFFPLHKSDLDTIIKLVATFYDLKKDGMNRRFYLADDYKGQNFNFNIENINRTYADGYEISLISIGVFGQPVLKLTDPRDKLPRNEKRIRFFLEYLLQVRENLMLPVDQRKRKWRSLIS